MAVTAGTLREEVGAGAADTAALERAVNVGKVLIDKYLADQEVLVADLGDVVYDEAWLAVAVELWNLRNAPNGVLAQQYGDPDVVAAPIRVGGDPLRGARQLLASWTIPAIG